MNKKGVSMYEVGDTIEMLEDCSGCKKGKEYVLKLYKKELFAWNDKIDNGCCCKGKWKLVSKASAIEVGDTVECINGQNYRFIKKGDRRKVLLVDECGRLELEDTTTYHHYEPQYFKLIKKGTKMEKYESMEKRINNLNNGWDKDADDVAKKLYDVTNLRVWSESYGNVGSFCVVTHGNTINQVANRQGIGKTEQKMSFDFDSQCDKMSAMRDTFMWLLNNSSIKKDEKQEKIDSIQSQINQLQGQLNNLKD